MRQITVFAMAAVTLLFFSLFIFARDTIIIVISIIAFSIAGVVVVTSLFFCISIYERYRKIRAERIEQEKKANVMVVTSGNQVYIRDTDHRAWWRGAHLDPRIYANSKETYRQPADREERAWLEFHKRPQKVIEGTLGNSTDSKSSPDLLTIFTQPSQSYAIIAGQQVGKTYQAQRIAEYWLRQNLKPIVIGPKRDTGEWTGCTFFGDGYNIGQVRRGLGIVRKLANDRHSSQLPHKQHKIQPVFIDDWTAIMQELRTDAEEFITKATVLYASVNIILYFIIHLDTAKAWGVNNLGAALKDNFIKLVIEPGYDGSGLINRRCNRGYIIRPGESKRDRQRVKLFDSVPVSQMVIDDNDNVFKRLVNGGMTRQNASQMAYGKDYAGTSHVRRCKQLLGEK